MKNILLLSIVLIFTNTLSAKVLISPINAMKEQYGENTTINKRNILLSTQKFKDIQKSANTRLNTKIYRIFTAKLNDKILGYGILINRTVRSKNMVVLYFISKNVLKDIQIIAFNEPPEYIPSTIWKSQFRNIKTTNMLRVSREIPTITGATLSARGVTDSSRIAFSIYNELFKGK